MFYHIIIKSVSLVSHGIARVIRGCDININFYSEFFVLPCPTRSR